MARVRKSKSSLRQSESLLEQAADAAASGDLQSAESLLRDALAIQEARLGADHPALATTLNNLAIACEAIDKLPDAERFYRRAYAVALDSFDPSHPQVSTSRRNLEEFCRTRGLEADAGSPDHGAARLSENRGALEAFVSEGQAWVAPPPTWSAPEEPVVEPALEASERATREAPALDTTMLDTVALDTAAPGAEDAPDSPAASAARTPWLRLGTLGAALLITALMGRAWFGTPVDPGLRGAQPTNTSARSEPSPTIHSAGPSSESGGAPPEPIANALVAPTADAPAAEPPPPPVVAAGAVAPPKAVATTGTRQEAGSGVQVMAAQICRDLSRGPGPWACSAPADPTGAGILYFYTRVVSPSGGEIEHRWYRGDALVQRVSLRVSANPAGYRTFSRQTTNAGSGNWHVELRSPDGTLLEERQFVVQ